MTKDEGIQTQQQNGDYQRERGWKEVEKGIRGINSDGRRLDLGW